MRTPDLSLKVPQIQPLTSAAVPTQDSPPAHTRVPFFRPDLTKAERRAVWSTLQSGWLTTGAVTRAFEHEFAEAVGAAHAIAVNSCTGALHLAVESLGLGPGQAVLVPTMTFAATAAVVCHSGAIPVLVDCDPVTGHMDLEDAGRKLQQLQSGHLPAGIPSDLKPVGIIPVHVGGLMMDMAAVRAFSALHGLWVVEDAAHSFPAAWRPGPEHSWQKCGDGTADVTCFSFYANKTITTGEGGMAVTGERRLADRIRMMSLHGLTQDAWGRYADNRAWDYQIIAPGHKYNLTDIAAAIGREQLRRAEDMRRRREALASRYREALQDLEAIELPVVVPDRIHAWHLWPIRLRLDRLRASRDEVLKTLKDEGVGCSVHWRPLHLHLFYQERFGWRSDDCPAATALWERLLSLPIFPGMRPDETAHVIERLRDVCAKFAA